jgi:hypothetical protein
MAPKRKSVFTETEEEFNTRRKQEKAEYWADYKKATELLKSLVRITDQYPHWSIDHDRIAIDDDEWSDETSADDE